jgi:hypothetical protein
LLARRAGIQSLLGDHGVLRFHCFSLALICVIRRRLLGSKVKESKVKESKVEGEKAISELMHRPLELFPCVVAPIVSLREVRAISG